MSKSESAGDPGAPHPCSVHSLYQSHSADYGACQFAVLNDPLSQCIYVVLLQWFATISMQLFSGLILPYLCCLSDWHT